MKLKINYKLGIGFGVLLMAISINSFLTLNILTKTTSLNNRIATIHTPSVSKLKDLDQIVTKSKSLLAVWLSDDRPIEEVEAKMALQRIYNDEYPVLRKEILTLMKRWEIEERKTMDITVFKLDSIMDFQHDIMIQFKEPNDYYQGGETKLRDAFVFRLNNNTGDIYEKIYEIKKRINKMIDKQQSEADKASTEMLRLFNRLKELILYLGLILIVGGGFVAFFTTRSIVKPVAKLREALVMMGKGILPEKTLNESDDEIGEMTVALNHLVDGLERTSSFANHIGKGDFDYSYKPLSDSDTLGNSLLVMKNNLQKVAIEDQKRNWATEGVALFGEVLRKHNDSVDVLSKTIISELVKYLDANQGSLYVIDDEKNIMALSGCYAWDRVKLIEGEVEIGDGLVGQCWQEKDTIYMNDVPEDYIKITSGLGKANPTSILITPLIHNTHVYGIIELASFHEIENYQIDFVKRVAETVAAMIASVKVNDKTKTLLEQSQKVSEQLKAREEELENNQESLKEEQMVMQKRLEDYEQKVARLERFNENLKEENKVLQNILLSKTKKLDELKDEKKS